MDANLGDVAAQGADAGAEDEGHQFVAGAVNDDMRGWWAEDSAAGVADDIVEEAQGAMHGAVLIVDETVGMITIGFGDKPAGGGQIVIVPGAQFEARGQVVGGRAPAVGKLPHHVEAAEDLEAGIAKDGGVGAGKMEK